MYHLCTKYRSELIWRYAMLLIWWEWEKSYWLQSKTLTRLPSLPCQYLAAIYKGNSLSSFMFYQNPNGILGVKDAFPEVYVRPIPWTAQCVDLWYIPLNPSTSMTLKDLPAVMIKPILFPSKVQWLIKQTVRGSCHSRLKSSLSQEKSLFKSNI